MSADKADYLHLLRAQMGLFDQLAKVRAEKNDNHDAKMDAWDQRRLDFSSNAEFEKVWQSTSIAERDRHLRVREQEILRQLDKVKVVLEHLRFAGLDDAAA